MNFQPTSLVGTKQSNYYDVSLYFFFIKLAISFTAFLSFNIMMMPFAEWSLLSVLFWVIIISDDFASYKSPISTLKQLG
jgi:hypothetical protein